MFVILIFLIDFRLNLIRFWTFLTPFLSVGEMPGFSGGVV